MPIDGSTLKKELEASQARISLLEKENLELRHEVSRLRAQVNTLKAHDIERKSILWKKLQSSMDSKIPDRSQQKVSTPVEKTEPNSALQKQFEQKEELSKSAPKGEMPAKPAKPVLQGPVNSNKEANGDNLHGKVATPPPPPPPLPSKLLARSKSLRRVPEVMEFYRALMKRDAQKETRTSATPNQPILNPRNMIGEIENRSTYLLNVSNNINFRSHFSLSWQLSQYKSPHLTTG